MRINGRHRAMIRRWALGLGIATCTSLLLGAVVWAASGSSAANGSPIGQSAADKLAKLHAVDAEATAAAKSWRAPKVSNAHASTPPASCPRSSLATGIYPGMDAAGFNDYIKNEAVIAPSASQPYQYVIVAGAERSNPQQGVLIVVRLDGDPCAPGAGGTQIHFFETPSQSGAVMLTQIQGDTVTFSTAGGSTGHFNVVAGQFS